MGVDFSGRVLLTADDTVSIVNVAADTVRTYDNFLDYPEGLEVEPPRCGRKTATIVGTTGEDDIVGSRFADVIATLGGPDTVKGGAGSDVICGGAGRDEINGGAGNDRCDGGPGRDRERRC
jgi:Ca2+-binding RTX toxin-like protein